LRPKKNRIPNHDPLAMAGIRASVPSPIFQPAKTQTLTPRSLATDGTQILITPRPCDRGTSETRCPSDPATAETQTLTHPRPCDLGNSDPSSPWYCDQGKLRLGIRPRPCDRRKLELSYCRGPATCGSSNPDTPAALRPTEAQTQTQPRPCDPRKLRAKRDRHLATTEAQIRMQLRPFDPCCLDPDAATTSRSENSETRRRRGLSTVRPQTLTIRQTLRINGSRRSSRRCLLDKNGFELCISTTLRPSRTQELHLGNPAIAKNP